MNYTQGKWEADHNTSVVLTHDNDGEVKHVIARHIINNDIDLISASPDMYEALKAWDKYATANYPENMKLKRIAWDLTEQAIAKAEGK